MVRLIPQGTGDCLIEEVPLAGLEPALSAPEADALSSEL